MGHIEMTDLNGNGPYIYTANHLHMHGPSEHKFNGRQYDLEFHIVHELTGGPGDWKSYKDTLAVVGVLFKVDKVSHPFIEKLNPIDFQPIEKINFAELLGCLDYMYDYTKEHLTEDQRLAEAQKDLSKNAFYHYKGSLTNPPCADVVNWNVYKRVLPIK
jgi:carbonic anhydrase